jgi:hypothetical protein
VLLLLLEGACVVTPLPTNKARIGGAGKSEELGRAEPNEGVTYPRANEVMYIYLVQRHNRSLEDS